MGLGSANFCLLVYDYTKKNMRAIVGLCTLELYLPESLTLKDKRAVVKSLLKRLRNTFNVAASEIDRLDNRQQAVIAFVTVSNSVNQVDKMMRQVMTWIEETYPQVQVMAEDIEII